MADFQRIHDQRTQELASTATVSGRLSDQAFYLDQAICGAVFRRFADHNMQWLIEYTFDWQASHLLNFLQSSCFPADWFSVERVDKYGKYDMEKYFGMPPMPDERKERTLWLGWRIAAEVGNWLTGDADTPQWDAGGLLWAEKHHLADWFSHRKIEPGIRQNCAAIWSAVCRSRWLQTLWSQRWGLTFY
jgi:hypothetical protein